MPEKVKLEVTVSGIETLHKALENAIKNLQSNVWFQLVSETSIIGAENPEGWEKFMHSEEFGKILEKLQENGYENTIQCIRSSFTKFVEEDNSGEWV